VAISSRNTVKLDALAQRYHTSVETIRAHNALPNDVFVRINPARSDRRQRDEYVRCKSELSVRASGMRYKTRSGDLVSISRKFNVSIGALSCGRIDRQNAAEGGQVLIVPGHADRTRNVYGATGDSLAYCQSAQRVGG
jgi:hypothetical protein